MVGRNYRTPPATILTYSYHLCNIQLIILIHYVTGNTILARAEEDELDDVVDIEGEDNQVVGDDTLGDDDDSIVKSSQDVDTTILFTKPITSLGDAVFGKYFLNIYTNIIKRIDLYVSKYVYNKLAQKVQYGFGRNLAWR